MKTIQRILAVLMVIAMLAVNPYCTSSVSFQLSVASVAGIFLFSPDIREKLISYKQRVI